MAVVQRHETMSFLNLNAVSNTTKDWSFLGTGFTDLNESPNAQTKEKRYINSVSESTDVTGYKPQYAYNTDQIKEDKAIEFICAIGKERKLGDDIERELVNVDTWKPIASKDNTFYARKELISVEVSSFSADDGEQRAEGNFNSKEDVIVGEFNTQTKTFAATTTVTP